MRNSILLLIPSAIILAVPIHAQSVSAKLDTATAEAIIDGCKAHSTSKEQSHAIAVFDAGGNPVAALRMEGNGPGIMAFAHDKARAVANWGFATAQMENAIKDVPGFAKAPFVVTVAGGVPFYTPDGKIFLGGVGVSGEAPTDDEACAKAGVLAAGQALQRVR